MPDWVTFKLKKLRLYKLVEMLKGRCIGCKAGAIVIPTDATMLMACTMLEKTYARVCPGAGNKVVLKDRICNPAVSR